MLYVYLFCYIYYNYETVSDPILFSLSFNVFKGRILFVII